MIRQCLFIGGRFDGHFYDVDTDMCNINLAYDPCTIPYYFRSEKDVIELVYEIYNRVELRCYGKEYFIYVAGEESKIMDLLINGYVPNQKEIV